jgi:hypothetical protein
MECRMNRRIWPALLLMPAAATSPWSIEALSRGARRMLTTTTLYVVLPACWYAGIAADVARDQWNWVLLDVLLVVPGVIRGFLGFLG